MPVSRTSNRKRARPSPSGRLETATATPPSWVNLSPLPTRLSSTCLSRVGSPLTIGGECSSSSKASPSPRSRACGSVSWRTRSRTSGTEKSIRSSSSPPASTREKSRMSLMTASRWRPESRIASTWRRSLSGRSAAASRSAMPSTPVSGVRISWLIAARNSALARAASSPAAGPPRPPPGLLRLPPGLLGLAPGAAELELVGGERRQVAQDLPLPLVELARPGVDGAQRAEAVPARLPPRVRECCPSPILRVGRRERG
jgi:hypothetical protein